MKASILPRLVQFLLLAAAFSLLSHPTLRAQVLAASNGESVNYFSFAGAPLGSTNFGLSLYGLATDSQQNLLVAVLDEGVVKLSGTTGSGSALPIGGSAAFYYGVAVDSSGNLYMTSSPDNGSASDIKVYKYNGDSGTPSLITDTGTTGSFGVRNTVAVDPVTGNIFVADNYENKIYEYPSSGGTVPIATLTTGVSSPYDIAIDKNENLYVSDGGNNSLIKFTDETGTPTTIDSSLVSAGGIALDGSNDVFVVGFNSTTSHGYVSEFAPDGALLSGTFVDLGASNQGDYITIVNVPEPDGNQLALLGAGIVMALAAIRRQTRKA